MTPTPPFDEVSRAEPDADNPLRRAEWIWPNGNLYLVNCFARFRHDFDLGKSPETAPLYITADKSYRLYVNGKYVCRGPARGYQAHWPYDRVDIRSFLKPGHNWLSVEAYTPGIGTFSYIHHGKAGLLCAAEWDNGTRIHSNEKDWWIRRSPGHNPNTARLTKQMDFQEDFDAGRDDRDWIVAEAFEEVGRDQPVWADREFSAPFGQPPYYDVEPRGIPMPLETLSPPPVPTCRGEGKAKPGYREAENIAWFFSEEEHPAMRYRRTTETPRMDGGYCLIDMPAAGEGGLVSVTFDLGADWLPGTLALEVENGGAGEVVDVFHHQYLEGGIPEFVTPGVGSLIALASRLRLAEGACRHEFFHIMGVRQFTVLARETARPLRIRLSWRGAAYPLEAAGRFHSSDPTLNAIWEISRHTQRTCSLDAFVDTPWREQAQWWGDARVQAKNVHYLAGDARLLRRGIRSIAGQESRYGLTYGHAPTVSGACILPDFAITWIVTIFDEWFYTGSLDVFRLQRGRIERILDYFETTRLPDGLLPHDRRFWLFEDWAELPKDGCPCFLNLWHLYGLESYLRLLRADGDEARSRSVEEDIASLRRLLVSRFLDTETGLLRPSISETGQWVGEPSCHDQVLAVLLDLASEAHGAMAAERIRPTLLGQPVAGARPSAFWATYLLEAARRLGLRAEALAFIRKNWARMVPSGTTWEVFERGDYPWSLCHAWSAHPLTHLSDLLLGVVQTAPAWGEALFEPFVPEDLDYAETTIPTPKGSLTASWRRQGKEVRYRLQAPESMPVRIRLPGMPPRLLADGGVFSESTIDGRGDTPNHRS